MNFIIILGASLLPSIILLLYIWRKDPKTEPLWWLLKAILMGVMICLPISIVEMGIKYIVFGERENPTGVMDAVAEAFIVPALIEESFKLIALWLVLRKNPYFDEHFDGIVYAVCIGLGFAASENILYVFESDDWLQVAAIRALLAVPGHYAFAILMGYYYSMYHFVNRSWRKAVYILLMPILAHGIYDGIAMSGAANPSIGIVTFLVLIYFCIKMHKMAKNRVMDSLKRDEVIRG